MFDPVTIGVAAMIWMAFKKQSSTQFGVLTSEREEVYRNAMEHLQDPRKLLQLAKDFEKEGLKAEAHWMRKRAEWRSRPEEVKAKHDEIFDKALDSENVSAILEVAKAFELMTATIKARQLRQRAKSLQESKNTKAEPASVETTAEETPEVMSRHTSEVVKKETPVHANGAAAKKENDDETSEKVLQS